MKIATFISLAFLSIFIHAQNVKMVEVKPIEVEVSYQLDQLNAENWKGKYTLMLEIGGGMAHSYVLEEHRAIINQFVMQRNKNRWKIELFNIHALLGETYMGYPKAGELTQIVNLDAAGVFQYRENIPEMKWQITSKTKTVMGYRCQSAIVSFRGRDYEAWFTTDIPLSFGPWKFQGLPGLILEIYDSKNEYHFTANGIQMVKGEKSIMMYDEEIRSIKRTRALKMEAMLHKNHGAYVADYGIVYRTSSGMENESQSYNPIELK